MHIALFGSAKIFRHVPYFFNCLIRIFVKIMIALKIVWLLRIHVVARQHMNKSIARFELHRHNQFHILPNPTFRKLNQLVDTFNCAQSSDLDELRRRQPDFLLVVQPENLVGRVPLEDLKKN